MDCTEEQLQVRGGWRACAGKCKRRELARLHLQPTHSCPALDSLLHSAASLTASTGSIGNNVAAALSVAASALFDDVRCSSVTLVAPAGHCEAMWSCEAALKVALPALPRGGNLRAV